MAVIALFIFLAVPWLGLYHTRSFLVSRQHFMYYNGSDVKLSILFEDITRKNIDCPTETTFNSNRSILEWPSVWLMCLIICN